MSECKAKKMKIDPTLMSFEAKKELLLHVSQHFNVCFYFTPLDWSDQELSTKSTFSFFGTFYIKNVFSRDGNHCLSPYLQKTVAP